MISSAVRLIAIPTLLTFVALNATGCAETQLAAHAIKRMAASDSSPKAFKVGSPYKINGRWYKPQIDMDYYKEGIASWYGPNFHGKYTANGELYNKYAFTAAHQTLPLPSIVRVTNLHNGKVVDVRINDRGPFVGERIIDLSYAAAKSIDMDKAGLAKVKVELLQEETLALYQVVPRAPRYAELFPKPKSKPYYVSDLGQPIEKPVYSQPEENKPTAKLAEVTQSSVKAVDGSKIYIQAASFTDYSNAQKLRDNLADRHPQKTVAVEPADVNGQAFYRVKMGPFNSKAHAQGYLTGLSSTGISSAKIVSLF